MVEAPAARTAIVTGASRSIGAATAVALAEAGMDVLVHFRGHRNDAEAVATQARRHGVDADVFGGDLTDEDMIEALFDHATARWGGIDVVIANAGAPNGPHGILEGTKTEFEQLLAINAASVFTVLQRAAERVRDGGSIVNIGSSSTLFPTPDRAMYSASKAAALVLVRALAAEVAARGITANSVVVGPIADGFLRGADDAALEPLRAASPFHRLGTPEDVAGVVRFLTSDDARWVTGQSIVVNGGADR